MTTPDLLQIVLYLALLALLAPPLGAWLALVYGGERLPVLGRVLGPVERSFYRLAGVRPEQEMGWKTYALCLLAANAAGFLLLYLLLRLQVVLPGNPEGFAGASPHLAFNTAVSFVTNTNWQSYSGETTLGWLAQTAGLTVQNFLSAATGMAVLAALARGLARREAAAVGSFWVDLTRSVLYVLLPLSLILALALVGQGVPQTFEASRQVELVQPLRDASGSEVREQSLALGPVASQVAIKQLGTNGGGFYNVNSAHPFENPTPLSNLLEVLAILLLPAACCLAFGRMVRDRRQGWALLAAMALVLVPLLFAGVAAEGAGNPAFTRLGLGPGGNLEGKELRFGVANSALWATATTAASNGSVNSMHDSFTPLGGLVPMLLMQLGEVIFGGVGSGLYGMLLFVLVAVFTAGLMIGRTPEYLGKKVEAREMKMASVGILVPCFAVLLGTAVASVTAPGLAGLAGSGPNNTGPHGFSEILYAFSSAGNNNGSAFAGLAANTPFYNFTLGLAMLFARYWVIVPALAIAGSLAAKKSVPVGPGTLPTHGPLFVVLLVAVVLIVGALTFLPALALGPIVEHLQMLARS
ncbi:MAG TPA: potassium-transporting ATPase subunit KdpA [Thermoanaerobaculia bacterium]|nr:potassium-transporting ATPase subunit KdpA [Thermoanaerobaculia bacterium]